MPALVAFNRRWAVGSDDFALPGIVSLLTRFVWMIAVSIIFIIHFTGHNHFESCQGEQKTIVYFSGFLFILIATIILEILIIYVSSRGTIVNVYPRRHIPRLLYIRLFLYIIEIIWSVFGIFIVHSHWKPESSACDGTIMNIILAVVLLSWFGLIINLIAVCVKFDPLGHVREKEKRKLHKRILRKSSVRSVFNVETPKALWERRCRGMCCCVKGDENAREAFKDVSSIFAQVFEDHDVVASDILAGLTVIQQQQKRLRLQGLMPQSSRTDFPEFNSPSTPEINILPTAVHFLQYALSSYGFLFYLFDHLSFGICKLCLHKDCICCCCGNQEDEGCTGYNTAVIKEMNNLRNDQIIYITHQNKIYEIPFFVAVDHDYKAVVISLRGTLSVEDALTDANAESTVMIVDNQRMYAHKGILMVSRNIKQILDQEKLIEKAYEKAKSKDYELVITGHSLGGGAAAILAILLKPQWPNVQCYAFASPGGLVSSVAVEYSRSFVTTVILGSDLISRMSLESLDDIKLQLIKVFMETDKSKIKLLTQACINGMCGDDSADLNDCDRMAVITDEDNQNYFEQYDHMIGDVAFDAEENSSLYQRNNYHGNGDHNSDADDDVDASFAADDEDENKFLYLPGQILWIKKISEGIERSSCCGRRHFVATWAKHADFSSILVKPSMITDHIPHNLMNAMRDIITNQQLQEV
ncbi:sn1-specific diacylglycerol lipase beta-like [Anneissia japonica]|uniref:sn1-specific diacylglycerol lipase beta-like n=1 Tax=Anneissia japonica TaxID=1529436 RepID=UPI0014256693|nr:sn1-specific diacylglycerol lipase beta-like [Anneissia japonica]XP_033123779.1 sn1-specific diacylglycerol lipase beta-like [Anneissia japonica]XP_033123780.1 sn1-specific diacylglycerol lipase beta-like [Anneissia japonica]